MLITADRVLVDSGVYLRDGAVLVEGASIAAVGPRDEVERRVPGGAPRLDFAGTVLPGLIDAHVHLVFHGGPDPLGTLRATDDTALFTAMRERAGRLLDSGVTTARDLGDRGRLALRLARETAAGATSGPRIVAAGVPATVPGGHCHFLGGEISGPGEARALVHRNLAAGAEVIKVMATGGGLTKDGPRTWQSQFSAEELAVLVAEAHGAGVPVAAHAHGTEGIAAAVDAGVDTLEHCTWMTAGGFDVRPDVLARIVERGIAVCPTVSPHWRMLPQVFGEERAAAMTANVRTMAEAGVRLIAGTDAGVQRTGFDGLAGALPFYAELGMSHAAVLDMATTHAAAALNIARETGRIAPGLRADLLLVAGDPLADLADLGRVHTVFAAGRRRDPAA
ncbi:amidohydrolase family protein [Streptomyces sp. NPDC050560]|uniref:amidohydrolase family protein n=1 Tax=Streptomyces sp. NPDC050560 TaxID=3365630 RepID=UPI0037934BB8